MNRSTGTPIVLMTALVLGGCHGAMGGGCLLCTPDTPHSIEGTVVGLRGVGLVLRDNGADDLPVSANGQFAFHTQLPPYQQYHVSVSGQPTNPIQHCMVMNGTGVGLIGTDNVMTVRVVCADVGRFVYAADPGDGTISAYTIDVVSGALTAVSGGPVKVPQSPWAIAADPAGKRLYAVDTGGISAYAIDRSTGALAVVAGSPFVTDAGPFTIVFHPNGRLAYTANTNSHSVSAYAVEATTGALTPIAGSPFASGMNPASVAVDPSGRFLYAVDSNGAASTVWAYTISASTGALAPIGGGPVAAGSAPDCVTVDPTGRFVYVANGVSNDVSAFTIDQSTGALTAVNGGRVAAGSNPGAVAVDPSGTYLFVANRNAIGTPGAGTVAVFSIDPMSGALLPVAGGPIAADTLPDSVAVDPSGRFVFVANGDPPANSISAFSLDDNTGTLTAVAGNPFPAGANPQFVTVTK